MIGLRIGLGSVAVILSAHMAVAQQTAARPQGRSMGDTAMMGQHMRAMDSVNTRLDSLVSQMNATSGDQKTNAMAEILTTLVSERRMMQQHMGQMHRGMRGNMSGKSSMQGRGNMRRPMSGDSASMDSTRSGQRP